MEYIKCYELCIDTLTLKESESPRVRMYLRTQGNTCFMLREM